MRLDNDRIILENREDIDLMQNMFDQQAKSMPLDTDREAELEAISKQLDALYRNW